MRILIFIALLLAHTVYLSEVNAIESVGIKDLRMAIIARDANKIDSLVKAGLSKVLLTQHLRYAIAISSNYNSKNVDVVKALIRNGANLETVKNLHAVLRTSDYELLKLLVHESTDFKVTENNKNLLQSIASMTFRGSGDQLRDTINRQLKIIQYLVDLDVFEIDSELLIRVIRSEQDPAKNGILQLLVENGLNLQQAVSEEYGKPLFVAAEHAHIDSLKYLVEQGVNLSYEGRKGENVLRNSIIYANPSNKIKVIKYLVMNQKSFTKTQLLSATKLAVGNGSPQEVADLLLSIGTKPDPAYSSDDTSITQSNDTLGVEIPQQKYTLVDGNDFKVVTSESNKDKGIKLDKKHAILSSIKKISLRYKDYTNSCTTSELDKQWGNGYYPNGGARSLYCHFKPILNLETFESIFTVFVKGPHKNGELDLYSKSEFGHYNPEFIRWVHNQLIPGKENNVEIVATLPIYNRYVKDIARIYYTVNKSINVNKEFKKHILEKYMTDINKGNYVDIYEYNECPNITSKWPEAYPVEWGKKYYVSSTAALFWLRREIDGTSILFDELITKLLKSYDLEFMEAVNNTTSSRTYSGSTCYRQEVYD